MLTTQPSATANRAPRALHHRGFHTVIPRSQPETKFLNADRAKKNLNFGCNFCDKNRKIRSDFDENP